MAENKTKEQQAGFRFVELIVFGTIFLALVASVFVLNIIISRDSQRDSEQVFCATKQSEYWQRAYRNLIRTQERLAELSIIDSSQVEQIAEKSAQLDTAFFNYKKSISIFDSTVIALDKGGVIMLEGSEFEIAPVTNPRARATIEKEIQKWSESRGVLIDLAEKTQNPRQIDPTQLEKAIDFAIQNDELILASNRDFIVRLGELSTEKIKNLQFAQVAALVVSILVFIGMAVRLTISLRKQAKIIQESQGQLIQNEKMASLGQMVAGLAHEMNTPLGFVRNNIEIIRENDREFQEAVVASSEILKNLAAGNYSEVEKQMPKTLEKLNSIEKIGLVDENAMMITNSLEGLDRIQELIVNLRNFSRLDQTATQLANLNQCLDSTLVIANHILKRHMTVVKDYGKIPDIVCAPAQLNQVFLNIITNAAHACEEKGEGTLRLKTFVEKNEAVVQISDNGKGIPQEVINKIFDPFFTTKPVGKGTGLGLSISKKIIEEGHNGRIAVKSKVGYGTDFFIYLPMQGKEEKVGKVFSESAPALN